ncbi:cytochrome p450, partial [Trifolium pratense]
DVTGLREVGCVRVERVGLRGGGSLHVFGIVEVDGTSLREQFGRLFDLVENKPASVAEMFMQDWGVRWEDHVSDRWQWQSDLDDGYTVRGAYQLLTTHDVVSLDVVLPTKANLVTRGILSSATHHCVSGCGEVESAQHLFLFCSTFGALWSLVSSWIGSHLVTAQLFPIILSVYSFSRWSSSTTFFHAAHLACLCVGGVDRKKSQIV